MKKIFKIAAVIIGFILFILLLLFVLFKFYPDKMSALILPHIKNVRMEASQKANGKMDLNIHANISESIIPYFLDSLQYKSVLYGDTISEGIKDDVSLISNNLLIVRIFLLPPIFLILFYEIRF